MENIDIMHDLKEPLFRWGPIPGYLINVDAWLSIFHDYPGRPHHYVWPPGYEIFRGGRMLFVNELEPLQKTGSEMFRKIILTGKRRKFFKLWQLRVSRLYSFCGKFDALTLRKMSGAALERDWRLLNRLIFKFWEPGVVPEISAYGGEAILKRELAEEGLAGQKQMLALSHLSAPMKPSFYQEEEISLLKVASRYGKKDFQHRLTAHCRKYFWIGNSYGAVRVMPEAHFLGRIRHFMKKKLSPARQISEIYRQLAFAQTNQRQALSLVRRKKLIKKISDGLAYCIWWQDQRKGLIFCYLHYLDLFVHEFSRRNQVAPALYHMAWYREINLHPSAGLIKELKSRRRLFVVHYNSRVFHSFTGRAAQIISRRYWQRRAATKGRELEGLVVFSAGQPVRGRVFLVRHHADLRRFPPGRILVTTMTAPEYISAIRRAKAIIADEGGLTCHAAIVSRELKIPCVVGTQMATKVLKDGDRVEVDATKGIIKKLKK
ncbi:MAG: PEP-utilizing enzyme [Patescibacteria group bacterium]